MFQVIVWEGDRRYRVVGEFPTYRVARRACRRALVKYWAGLVSCRPEVTRLEPGFMANLCQPLTGNYGRQTFNEDGYQESFTPCEALR